MFKLPVCPYCRTVYTSKEVKKISKSKIHKCYHCNKKFKVSYIKGRIIFLAADIIVLVLINFFILKFIKQSNIYICLAVTMVLISISFLLLPRTVKFLKNIENL